MSNTFQDSVSTMFRTHGQMHRLIDSNYAGGGIKTLQATMLQNRHQWINVSSRHQPDLQSLPMDQHQTLTSQCRTQMFLDDCCSHTDIFLHIENSRSNAGALLGFQPHSDTYSSIHYFITSLLYTSCDMCKYANM